MKSGKCLSDASTAQRRPSELKQHPVEEWCHFAVRNIGQHQLSSVTMACMFNCVRENDSYFDLQSVGLRAAHDIRSRNQRHKLTPFSDTGFQCQFFVPYASGMKISGAKNKYGCK